MNRAAMTMAALSSAVALSVVASLVLIPTARAAVLAVPWALLLVACATLGLAPFGAPHITEKLRMIRAGTLRRPLDWFDLAMHSAPWLLLAARAVAAGIPG
jgi:hypothetical protein